MERPSGVPSYRYGPGVTQRRDLEYGLLEAVFEDRAALEAVMSEFLGSHGKVAAMIARYLRMFQRDIHTLLGQASVPGCRVCEAVRRTTRRAYAEVDAYKEHNADNRSDLLTKPVKPPTFRKLVGRLKGFHGIPKL